MKFSQRHYSFVQLIKTEIQLKKVSRQGVPVNKGSTVLISSKHNSDHTFGMFVGKYQFDLLMIFSYGNE